MRIKTAEKESRDARPCVSAHKGIFITLEGPDGSGKSTQIKILSRRLQDQGLAFLITREPGGGSKNSLPEKIRKLLLSQRNDSLVPQAELFLFLAARAQHVAEIIRPALRQNRVVISERFSDATLAYQAGGRGISSTFIRAADRFATGGLKPDLTLLLDVLPQEGLRRAFQAKTGHDRMEAQSPVFHQAVRRAYLQIARSESRRMKIVAAGQKPEAVADQIWQAVQRRLSKS